MDTFAFIIHPINAKRDVSRKFPTLGRFLSERQINFFSTYFPPVYLSEVEGIQSAATGKKVKGWLVACPLTADRMMSLPEKTVYRKIIQTGKLAERLGAMILGLGAFTSVVGDSGLTIARSLDIPVTTGDTYTVATALQAVRRAAQMMDIPLGEARAAVVGATGTIGRICAQILAEEVAQITLIGLRKPALEALQAELQGTESSAAIQLSTNLESLREAELILTVTSSLNAIIQPEQLRPGSIVCDVARPRDVSQRVAALRDDVLVIDGGMVEIPGPANFNFDFGFPPGMGFACMAETIALTLEGRFESYTLGKRVTRSRVEEIAAIAQKHGFKLSGFRSFEKPVSVEKLEKVYSFARNSATA